MPYTFTLTATIPATPEEIYQAWLDSLGHSEMTGGEASMSDQIGAEVSAWDGYISGRNLELIPGERIVQSWRTTEFGDEHEDSVITVVLEEVGDDTLLTLEHSNVPDEQRSYEEGGWQSNYFEPMVAYFTERRGRSRGTGAAQNCKKRHVEDRAKKAAKPRAKSVGKAKRSASATTSARRARRSQSVRRRGQRRRRKEQSTSKGKTRASAMRSLAKPSSRKSSRGTRR